MSFPNGRPRFEEEPVPEDFIPVTLDAQIAGECVGLWVGSAGAVAVTMLSGEDRVIPGVAAGTFLKGRFQVVKTTGTTVTTPTSNILAAVLI